MCYRLLIASCATWGLIAHIPTAGAMTIQEAIQMATNTHPQSRVAELRVAAASGNASDQSAYAYNPELSIEPQSRRLAGGGRTNDYYLTLSQGIETGGKHGYRKAAEEAGVGVAKADREALDQQLMTRAAAAYVNLFYAHEALLLSRQISELYRQVMGGIERQLAVGEASRLDVNLVQSAYASSLNASVTAEQTFLLRQQEYFSAVGKVDSTPLKLPRLPVAWQAPANPDELAWTSRADLQALRHKAEQAQSLSQLASADRIPDITVSVMAGREAGDQLLKVGVSVPLPVLNRHQGAYQAALAEEERSRTDVAWAKQQLQFEVQSALRNHEATSRAALAVETSSIISDSDKAIDLARRAYEAGELDPEEMVLRIKQATDAQLTSMETLRLAWLARIRLAEVLGHPEIIIEGTQS